MSHAPTPSASSSSSCVSRKPDPPPRPRGVRATIARTAAILLLAILLAAPCTALAGPEGGPDTSAAAPRISLLTIGPGELFFERFGHNAIVVRDADGDARSYNYGVFDFFEDDFLANFIGGRMRYLVMEFPYEEDLAVYRDEHRTITEQVLDLDPQQARALAGYLEWNARPENARYPYDYFASNCSTRVRDALDRALGGALKAQSEGRSRGFTWRMDALRMMAPEPLLMLVIDLGLGPAADRRTDFWEESFLPEVLAHVVADARVAGTEGDHPLVAETIRIADGTVAAPPLLPPDLRWPFLIAGLSIGILLATAGRSARPGPVRAVAAFAFAFQFTAGIVGSILLFLWLGTEHRAAWRNENLLLLNPLAFALLPGWWRVLRGRAPRRFAPRMAGLAVLLGAFALFSKILATFAQENLHWILLLLPIHLALALVLLRRRNPA